MNELGFFDYLILGAAVAVWWRVYLAPQPPPGAPAAVGHRPASTGPTGARLSAPEMPADINAPLAETLSRICLARGYPGIKTFLDGAKGAYEAIVERFAEGNLAPVADLLSAAVSETFSAAVAARRSAGESIDLTFIGFREVDIIEARIEEHRSWIEVKFVPELVSVTRDGHGRVIAGDPGRVVTIPELWTFECDLRSKRPDWLLAATEPIQCP